MDTQSDQSKQTAYQLARKSLIFGILSLFGPAVTLLFSFDLYSTDEPLFVFGWIVSLLGLPALIIGNQALKKITANNNEEGKGFALAGIILGAVGIFFDVCFLSMSVLARASF